MLLLACKHEEKVDEIRGAGPLPDVDPGEEHGEDGGGGGDHVDVGQGEVPEAVELADDAEAARDSARQQLQSHSSQEQGTKCYDPAGSVSPPSLQQNMPLKLCRVTRVPYSLFFRRNTHNIR